MPRRAMTLVADCYLSTPLRATTTWIDEHCSCVSPRVTARDKWWCPVHSCNGYYTKKDYPPSAGHPGAHRMFLSLRRAYFSPRMAGDWYETVSNCDASARNRISEKAKTNPLKLFPANGPLESVAMDILGPLPRTKTLATTHVFTRPWAMPR
jgi:hypothetical protein